MRIFAYTYTCAHIIYICVYIYIYLYPKGFAPCRRPLSDGAWLDDLLMPAGWLACSLF